MLTWFPTSSSRGKQRDGRGRRDKEVIFTNPIEVVKSTRSYAGGQAIGTNTEASERKESSDVRQASNEEQTEVEEVKSGVSLTAMMLDRQIVVREGEKKSM